MPEETPPFRIALDTLEEGANSLRLEGRAEQIDLPEEEVEVIGAILFEGSLIRSHTSVEVQGRVSVRVRQRCVRCLAEVEAPLDPEVRVYCKKRRARDGAGSDPESPEEGLLYYDGRTLDLGGEIRETLLLELPTHPLCRPQCKGLCPRCGNDQNLGDCACAPLGSAGPLESLRTVLEGEHRSAGTSEGEATQDGKRENRREKE